MSVGPGDLAPAFTLPAVDADGRREISLSDHAGEIVVLIFYPGDDTAVCTRQLCTYTSEIERFADVGARVLAMSPQSVDSHERFAARQGGFAFPLLADEDKAVGRAYGVVGPLGFYRRSAFVVGADGRITWAHRSLTGATFTPTAQLVKAVESAG